MNNETVYSEKKNINPRNTPLNALIILLVLVIIGVSQVVNTIQFFNQQSRLPVHKVDGGSSRFEEINVVSGITLFGDSMAVTAEDVLLTGYIKQGMSDYVPQRLWNPDSSLFSLDLQTGTINWQAEAVPQFVIVNADKVFSVLDSGESVRSIAAYELNNGEKIWQTPLDSLNAIGVDHIAASNTKLFVRTYHRSSRAFYVLDMKTGEIDNVMKENLRSVLPTNNISSAFYAENDISTLYFLSQYSVATSGNRAWSTRLINGCDYCSLTNPLVVDGLILVQSSGNPYHGFLNAIDRYTGDLLWRIDKHIISNIAVDGQVVFFLTDNAELVAANITTGEAIASLYFKPSFSEDFDFNNQFQVAAHNNIVAIYFADNRQLFVFRFQ